MGSRLTIFWSRRATDIKPGMKIYAPSMQQYVLYLIQVTDLTHIRHKLSSLHQNS